MSETDGKQWTTSLDVARKFGKDHGDVLDRIRECVQLSQEEHRPNFRLISLPDSYGRQQPAYELTRAGFSILVMGFTGPEALACIVGTSMQARGLWWLVE